MQGITPVGSPEWQPSEVEYLGKLSGLTIMGSTSETVQGSPDITVLLKKENGETEEVFQMRKRLTLRLAGIPNFPLNNLTAVTAARMAVNKATLAVKYAKQVEDILDYLLKLAS